MKLNNLYNFKNPIKHFLNVDNLIFPSDISSFDVTKLCWTKPINFRVRKQGDKYRTLKMPNVLSFVRAYYYYKDLPEFGEIQSIDVVHKRMSANIETGDFVAGEYDRQLEDDFSKLCIYDYMLKLDIKEYYGRIYTHDLGLDVQSKRDNVLSGLNYGCTSGLLMGNYISLYFAEKMLDNISKHLERLIQESQIQCDYTYFSDDFFFFCNKKDIENIIKCFDESLELYGFERNDNKKELWSYEQYNSYNLLTRFWKSIKRHCNEEIIKDKINEGNLNRDIKHKLAFLNQLIYRMNNLKDEKSKKIFINNYFKEKSFRELNLEEYTIKEYDYHQLCFLLKFSPESLLYSIDKFSSMTTFDKNKLYKFFSVRYAEILSEPFNEEQLYYYYAIKQLGFGDILLNTKGLVIKSNNQILISYYLSEQLFDNNDLLALKMDTDEASWFKNYHLILYASDLKEDLDNSINTYLVPKNARTNEIKSRTYFDFYKENILTNKEIICSIESIKENIEDYLNLRYEETALDFEE